MKRFILLILILCAGIVYAQSQIIPKEYLNIFDQLKLNDKYEIKKFLKPSFLIADFNGDHINDIVFLITERKSHKKGILILFGKTNQYFVFGAGNKLGKAGFDDSDDLKWMQGWEVYKQKSAYEPKFNNGDIVGSIKRKLPNIGISMWSVEDGEPLAGGIIYWNGKKWTWIHQGE